MLRRSSSSSRPTVFVFVKAAATADGVGPVGLATGGAAGGRGLGGTFTLTGVARSLAGVCRFAVDGNARTSLGPCAGSPVSGGRSTRV